MATVPFMVQIGTVEHVLANVELEIRTPKKGLIGKLFSLNDQNFSVAITKRPLATTTIGKEIPSNSATVVMGATPPILITITTATGLSILRFTMAPI